MFVKNLTYCHVKHESEVMVPSENTIKSTPTTCGKSPFISCPSGLLDEIRAANISKSERVTP